MKSEIVWALKKNTKNQHNLLACNNSSDLKYLFGIFPYTDLVSKLGLLTM